MFHEDTQLATEWKGQKLTEVTVITVLVMYDQHKFQVFSKIYIVAL